MLPPAFIRNPFQRCELQSCHDAQRIGPLRNARVNCKYQSIGGIAIRMKGFEDVDENLSCNLQ